MSKDKIFLDANILFSVAYGSSTLDYLWEISKKGHCLLLASNYVIEEARRNLTTKKQLKKLDACLADVQVVLEADPALPCPIDLPDKDRPVLMAAITAKADYLITGDIKHFENHFGKKVIDLKICMARDYLQPKMMPKPA